MDIGEMVRDKITSSGLRILVFGPQVKDLSTDERTRNLQLKRKQIREELESDGHTVKYAEDIVDPSISGAPGNPLVQEMLIMDRYDFIVTLVESPGSIVEATTIAHNPSLARKSSLFMDEDYGDGLSAAGACDLASKMGADFQTYKYPEDLVDCHLLGFVRKKVEQVQLAIFLS